MRPLRKGAARTALAENLRSLLIKLQVEEHMLLQAVGGEATLVRTAAVLGGAIEAALLEIYPTMIDSQPMIQKQFIATFWRLANENAWRMTRNLEASGLLEKIR